MEKVCDTADGVLRLVGKTASWLLVALIAVTVFDVISRKFFSLQSVRFQEMEWHLHAAVMFLCIGWVYADDRHIRVDLCRVMMSRNGQRALEIFALLVFAAPFCVVFLIEAIDFVNWAYKSNESSASVSGLPYRWIIKSFMIASASLMLLSVLARLLREVFAPMSVELAHVANDGEGAATEALPGANG